MSSNIRVERICQECLNAFIAKTTVTKYCSDRCAKRAYKRRKRNNAIESSTEHSAQVATALESRIAHLAYLSIAQTSDLIGVSRTTIHRIVKRGDLSVLRVGKRVIIPKSEILKLIRNDSNTT